MTVDEAVDTESQQYLMGMKRNSLDAQCIRNWLHGGSETVWGKW